jgi:tetratricopeptide (TPR) repeat protein
MYISSISASFFLPKYALPVGKRLFYSTISSYTLNKMPRSLLSLSLLLFWANPATAALSANELADEAASLASKEQYQQALHRYNKALKLKPHNASLHLSVGLVYQSMEQYEDSIRSIETALSLSPEMPQAHYSLALLHEAQAIRAGDDGRKEKRIKHLEAARASWTAYLRLEKDGEKKKTARKHIGDIKAQLQE